MSEPDYSAAEHVLRRHYFRLCAQVAAEILGERGTADELLDEILENYARKFYALSVVENQLHGRTGAVPQALASVCMTAEPDKAVAATRQTHEVPIGPLRVSTVHCRADILTETINEWLSKHANTDVVSINFTQLGSGLSCVILHRAK